MRGVCIRITSIFRTGADGVSNENRKATEKADDLKAFIQRFSANASKSKQATSRKKLLEKLTIEDMPVSSRKYPFIQFKPERPCGNTILEITGLGKEIQGVSVLNNLNLTVRKGDKIAFVGSDGPAKTTLFQILAGEMKPDSGSFRWGRRLPPPISRGRTALTSGAT